MQSINRHLTTLADQKYLNSRPNEIKMDFVAAMTLLALLGVATVNSVTVTTKVGDIAGVSHKWRNTTVNKFLGIPYGESPTGNLRFQAPVPKAAFSSPFNAANSGLSCVQNRAASAGLVLSEDCLNLDVYVPVGGASTKAVMVWIYGGAFTRGSTVGYDGTKMAAVGDVIVVTLNYRIGIFGFFTTGDDNASGNYGLLDQQLALKWVNKNIGAFGGDKDRVTIFGESAGASSVSWQMLAPSNKGLFQRVIAQSGVASSPWSLPDPKTTAAYTAHLAKTLGCSDTDSSRVVECLRKLPSTAFGHENATDWPFTITYEAPAGPRVDGKFIPNSPTCRDSGRRIEDQPLFRSLDFLLGANKYEASPVFAGINFGFRPGNLYKGVSKSVFEKLASTYGGVDDKNGVQSLWTRYAKGQPQMPDGRELLEFLGDAMFYDHILKTANRHALSSSGSTYFYSFLPMPSKEVGGLGHGFPLSPYVDGSIHFDEVGFIFGNTTMWEIGSKTPGEDELSDAMILFWTNFAKSGNPNMPSPVQQQWPEYTTTNKKFIEFDIQNKTLDLRSSSSYRAQYMSYWEDVKPRLPSLCISSSGATSYLRLNGVFPALVAVCLVTAVKMLQ